MKRIIQCTHCGVSKTVQYHGNSRGPRTPYGWTEKFELTFGKRYARRREVICPECKKRGVA